MNFADTLDSLAAAAEAHMHTAATFLLGAYASASTTIATAEASDPLVKAAADLAIQEANAHGVPVGSVETVGADVLQLAQTIAAATKAPPAAAAASGAS
jgi:hypothetical protein